MSQVSGLNRIDTKHHESDFRKVVCPFHRMISIGDASQDEMFHRTPHKGVSHNRPIRSRQTTSLLSSFEVAFEFKVVSRIHRESIIGVTRSLPTTVGAVHIASAASPVNATPSTSTTTPTQQGSPSPETTISPTTTIGNTTSSPPGGALPTTGVQSLMLLISGAILLLTGAFPLVRHRSRDMS